MREFEIEKTDGYFIAPAPIGRERNLSLSAKGLMYVFFSLPPEWDYSFNGLVAICKEGRCTVRNAINELKEAGYIDISQFRTERGQFKYKYTVYNKPHLERVLNGNEPRAEIPTTDSPTTVERQQLNNNKLNNKNKIDNKDKDDKSNSNEIKHNILTLELINMNYISNEDVSSFYFDSLFKDYIDNGYSYRELLGAIHYIVPRVMSRSFIDEDGNKIENKYGYFKNAIEANFEKLNNLSKELYPDDPNHSFWDDYEL